MSHNFSGRELVNGYRKLKEHQFGGGVRGFYFIKTCLRGIKRSMRSNFQVAEGMYILAD